MKQRDINDTLIDIVKVAAIVIIGFIVISG